MKDKIRAAFAEIKADDALIENTLAFLIAEAGQQQHRAKRGRIPMRFRAVAAMALLVAGLFAYNLYFTATAHISVDINPSVELTLNRFDWVIDTCAFNEDGAHVLSEVNVRGKTYAEAAALLLSAIEAGGYIAEDALISVTVQADSNKKEQALCEVMLQFVNEEILPVWASAEIEVFPVSSDIWRNAHGCHMSPAKFLAIQELIEADNTAALEDYTDASIRQIRRRVQECRNGHTEPDDGNLELGAQNKQGHEPGNDHGHGYRGSH